MPGTPVKFGVYVGLYTLFWIAISVIVYRIFFIDSHVTIHEGAYFFLSGLVWLVCGAIRSVRPTERAKLTQRDPVVRSFALAGLLLLLYANAA
ncbi:MAG: hypothetical protein ACXVO1_11490 [Tumebacillaceae bacterium]